MNRQKILVVDDNTTNIKVLNDLLKSDYKISVATNGRDALEIVSKSNPDLILLDIMMPEMDGYEVCKVLKAGDNTKDIPVIFVTAKGETEDEEIGFKIGAVDYITKPIVPSIVKARVKTHLELKESREILKKQNIILEEKVRERTEEVVETRLEIIRRLGRAAEYKDNETGMHVIRMSKYSQQIALAHGLSREEAELILHASPMHDIGKIGIPDKVLLKPGKLDPDEWNIMMTHAEIGGDIIADHPSELLQAAKTAALSHHEKWNGKGYPEGISGEDIPLIGRIVAIADVFDALTSERPYKKAWEVERATNLIKEEAGEHFDPALVDAFFKCFEAILEIKNKFGDHPGQSH